jgi:ABC-type lipoprotein export system ATPase subunit
MKSITINNIGPITNVVLKLNKINVLMGPQSSGKSTIAKIISYCQWVEKRYILDKEYNYKVSTQLLEFHRISKNSFTDNSYIEYETDSIKISYKGRELEESIELKKNSLKFKKGKNIYIPSERNFVSVIPNLSKYKETNDNIMSFVYDWYNAKRKFSNNNSLPILNLGINFYNDDDEDKDVLVLKNSKNEILLREGSSGLQSIIPLVLIIEYLTNIFYEENKSESVDELDSMKSFISKNLLDILTKKRQKEIVQKSKNKEEISLSKSEISKFAELMVSRINYSKTNFIIEEPEQNLFPETQRDLIYFIFNKLKSKRDHSLILTTHSPYILYSINNCLLGYTVKNKMPLSEQKELLSHKSWVNPDFVSIWQVKNGEVISVIDERTKTVTKHYFNEMTNEIMDEYYDMLNYFEYDKED